MARYSPHALPPAADRVWLMVPYSEKEQAKACGAKFDGLTSCWWILRRDLAANPDAARWMFQEDKPQAMRSEPKPKPHRRSTPHEPVLPVDPHDDQRSLFPATQAPDVRPLTTCDCRTIPPWEHCEHNLA